jgi:flagellar biosynthesis repressor protein FlbT
MPLKLKLGANERLVVNGAVLVNGAYRTTLLVKNFAHIMREKDVLQEEDANTPTKRLYFLIQAMLMQPPPPDPLMETYRSVQAQLHDVYIKVDNLAVLKDVDTLVNLGDYYKALAKLHPLIAYEAKLLNVDQHEWRRGGASPRLGILTDPVDQAVPAT